MHRFFIPRPYAENMMIDGIDARHIYTVLKMKLGEKVHVETGIFGAEMKVQLINDGPVTILLDSERTF